MADAASLDAVSAAGRALLSEDSGGKEWRVEAKVKSIQSATAMQRTFSEVTATETCFGRGTATEC